MKSSEKTSKKSPKGKPEVTKENKKPPIKVVEQKETTKPQPTKNQTKDEKNSKVSKTSKNVKPQQKAENLEKEMLKGQNHIEEKKDEKKTDKKTEKKADKKTDKKTDKKDEKKSEKKTDKKEDSKEEKKEDEIKKEEIEEKYAPPQEVIKEENRKQMLVKPRQTYLQEKMSQMNYNANLLNNIQKEMENKIKNIMEEEGVVVGDKTKDLKKIMEVKDKTRIEIENYMNKQKYKEMKNLNDELHSLKINLKQIEENEKMISQSIEQNSNKNNSETFNEKANFDKSQKLSKLREIQGKKSEIQEKIADINYKIKSAIENENMSTIPNKQRVKDFITNFERDKEIIEIRAKKYFQETRERNKRQQNNINQLMEKIKKEIEEKEKKENEEANKLRQDFKKEEKAKEKEISKKNEQILLKYKPYMSQKLETKKYLYNERYDKFIEKEKKYFQKEVEKNKEKKDKLIYKFDEIDKFAQEFDEKIETRKYDQEQKSMELYQKWNENKEKLPKNSNHFQSIELQNKKKMLDDEKRSQSLKKKVQKYSNDIRETFSPEIDTKKREQLQTIIQSLEDPKKVAKRYTLKKQKKNRIIIKKRDTSKPSKFGWELKLDPNPNKEENYIKKPKKLNLLPIIRTTTEIPVKKPDYLSQIINKKKINNRSNSSKGRDNYEDEFINVNKKNEKWEEVMKNNNVSLLENINKVQNKVENLEQEAEEKEKLLKLRGGIENNPQLGKQVSNLLIDSIEAKINMIKKMNNVQ